MNTISMQTQSQSTSQSDSLFEGVTPPIGVFDELKQAPHANSVWKPLQNHFEDLGSEEIRKIWAQGENLLRENGVAYNPLTEDTNVRLLELDPIPLMLSNEEFQQLANGIQQRARLLNDILKDCYESQQLLHDGLLPKELLYEQNGFNRSLCHIMQEESQYLHYYAVDMARNPDGSWVVLADHTQAPTGAGFALENRIVTTSLFSNLAKKQRLIRIANYFESFRDTLHSYAPAGAEKPLVVFLSPSPHDPIYFEDAYLSQYLGITIAQGSELTVRNNRVYLKAISGLIRVHVIVRRVHESDADPLTKPTESYNGVPGLMQAVRAGSVRLINPPGTGIVESPTLFPYLDAISMHLHGVKLQIPSVATHWQQEDDHEFSSIPLPTFKKAAFPVKSYTDNPSTLDPIQLDQAASQTVTQKEVALSHAPAWRDSGIVSQPVTMRFYAYANGDDYHVMPGGIARYQLSPEDRIVSSRVKNITLGCKDIWIISETTHAPEEKYESRLRKTHTIKRSNGELSSRAADNLFWLGRYSERAEFVTRLTLELILNLTEKERQVDICSLKTILLTLEENLFIPKEISNQDDVIQDRAKLFSILTECSFSSSTNLANTLPKTLSNLLNLTSLSRSRLSNELWRIVRQLEQQVHDPPPLNFSDFRLTLQRSILYYSALNGTYLSNLTRTQGWDFITIGKKIENAYWLICLIEAVLSQKTKTPQSLLNSLLSINDTILTYRFRYDGPPQLASTLDLILFDTANPRSLITQLITSENSLRSLRPDSEDPISSAQRIIRRSINFFETEFIDTSSPEVTQESIENVHSHLKTLKQEIATISEKLGWEFFTHVEYKSS